jgi:hypothetical protein
MTYDPGRFKKTLIYSRTAPIPTLLEDLAAVRGFDGRNEKLNLVWKLMGSAGVVGLIYGFATGAAQRGMSDPSFFFFIVVPAAAAVVGIGLAIGRSKFNLENRRYELAERILQFLRRDSRPDAEVFIETDFRKPNHKAKHVRKGKVGVWSVNYYTDRWLQVRGRLLDGTAYQLQAVEQHQVRTKSYRSASGKAKTKTKTKSATELIFRLRVKRRRYPRLPAAEDARRSVQLPMWASLKACRIHASEDSPVGTLLLKTTTKQNWTCAASGQAEPPTSGVRWFAMSFLSLYQMLNLARNPEKA